MKISFSWIKDWSCVPRLALLRRRGEGAEYAVAARRGGRVEIEESGFVADAGALVQEPAIPTWETSRLCRPIRQL